MERFIAEHERFNLDFCLPELEKLIHDKRAFFDNPLGNALKYQKVLNNMPDVVSSETRLDQDIVAAGKRSDINEKERQKIKASLFELSPWRKGPFDIFGIDIDSEWQSFIKWNRFIDEISLLKGRRVLDIGSSNGYYMFKMAAHDPFMVLGLEPQLAFYFQYLALQKIIRQENLFSLPITFDELPLMDRYFDTVFCMGVLYHRKSPLEMLQKIHDSLKKGGELVLENLIIGSSDHFCLFPESRYAKMRNVFFIPSIKCMESWLKRTGFTNIRCVDISKTTTGEQRKTKWIQTESLKDFLDPEDNEKTVEGYPAPLRAIFIANAA